MEYWEYNIKVYFAFIDFRQAYDSVRREEIPNKLIELVKATVDNMGAKAEVQTKMTEIFEIRYGLKQRDGLAPLLFNLIMELVVRKVTADRNDKLQYTLIQKAVYADTTVYA
jgi:hypothetical protein